MQGKYVVLVLIALFCCQCGRNTTDSTNSDVSLALPERVDSVGEPILPVVQDQELSAAVVLLGKRLYEDPRLSGSGQVSCATCHPADGAGMVTSAATPTDGTSYYDIPTIFNTGDQFAYFWNGRGQNLESVVQISMRAENIMDAAWPTVLPRLSEDEEYRQLFDRAFPGSGVTEENTVGALTTYVRSLITPNAAFDRWLNGESLSEGAMAGYELFKEYGCIRCHQGRGVGGNMYASFRDYIESRGTERTTDLGRFNITNVEAHKYQFKVPSLRNVAVTAPYFHDGSATELSDAVDAMARHQLGLTLSRIEINQIVDFLESLTGWRDGRLLGGTP